MDEERREFSDKAKLEQAMKLSNAETLMEALKVHDNNS